MEQLRKEEEEVGFECSQKGADDKCQRQSVVKSSTPLLSTIEKEIWSPLLNLDRSIALQLFPFSRSVRQNPLMMSDAKRKCK